MQATCRAQQLQEASAHSNAVISGLGPEIECVHTYVACDRIACLYNAPSETLIQAHAEQSGFSANRITPISAVIDPSTADG